jgi:3-hydroxyisobutyrate dehydrogenase-like beta-hydroxyacid dehydrogenase
MSDQATKKISLLGMGEVGAGIASAFVALGYEVTAFDVRPDAAEKRLAQHDLTGRVQLVDIRQAAAGALVISAVIPAAAVALLEQLSNERLGSGAILDINSTGPDEKRAMADLAKTAGFTSFTDGTIGGGGFRLDPGPVFHLAGPDAACWDELLRGAGFRTDILSESADGVGKAALLKMVRTTFTKGYEALIVESLGIAWQGGVLDSVVESIGMTFDHLPFSEQARLLASGHVSHASRRLVEVQMARAAAESIVPDETLAMVAGTETRYRLSSERLGDRYGKAEPTDLRAALELLKA